MLSRYRCLTHANKPRTPLPETCAHIEDLAPRMRQEQLAGLRCRITGGIDGHGGGRGPLVVLMHGFGAPGDDLVPLAEHLDAPAGTRFVFPEAPLALPQYGNGRAWWMIDLEGMEQDRRAGKPRDLSRSVPVGLTDVRTKMSSVLSELEHRLQADPKQVVLGGFSQGAMLACDLALRTNRPLAGLVLLSGTLVARDEWLPLMPARRGLKVLQSHGTQDPILPHFLAEQLKDHLVKAGLVVDWTSFRGGHEIPAAVLTRLGGFLHHAFTHYSAVSNIDNTCGLCHAPFRHDARRTDTGSRHLGDHPQDGR